MRESPEKPAVYKEQLLREMREGTFKRGAMDFPDGIIPLSEEVRNVYSDAFPDSRYDIKVTKVYADKSRGKILCSLWIKPKLGVKIGPMTGPGTSFYDYVEYGDFESIINLFT